jgi:predicted metalloprotease with PDZ domain
MLFATFALLLFAAFSGISAQTINARISVVSVNPAMIRVEARIPSAANRLSFRNAYGGVLGLGERIELVEGIGDNGARVSFEKVAPGEFKCTEKVSRFAYEVNLAQSLRSADLSHVSSLDSDRGLLMLADLLPQSTSSENSFVSAMVNIDPPAGWTVTSNVENSGPQFLTDDPQSAVFLIGASLGQERRRLSKTILSIITSGQWSLRDNDATKIAEKILSEYSRVTGFELKRNPVVMLVPYPADAGPDNWSAETRGNVVVLVLGRKASRKKVLSRLGIVLSHELFHLWVPNSLKLEGAYDWFFEGFTLYHALRIDLRLGLVSFSDYLDTIARVYDSYRSSADGDRLSLIEAAETRWTTGSPLVYEKGMLAAFIYDLSLRKLSDCSATLDDVYAALFRLSTTGQRSGNETIISLLSEREGLQTFARDYVAKATSIDLASAVSEYGLQVQREGPGTTLVVARDLTKTQRRLLGCIGYRR